MGWHPWHFGENSLFIGFKETFRNLVWVKSCQLPRFFFREIAASLHTCHFCCSIFLRSFYGFGIRKCICRRESMQSFVEIWNDDDAKSRLFCKTRPRNFKLKPHMCQLSCVFSCCCFAEMRLRKLTLWQNYVRYRTEITYEFTAHFYIMESRITNVLVFNVKK